MTVDAPQARPRRFNWIKLRHWVSSHFRLPGAEDPAPASRHLARVCGWAAALGLGGMGVALRAFVGLVYADRGWFAPTVIAVGLIGIGCTIGAFASVHQRRLPMILLGVATAALLTGWFVTSL
jgi:hypothetical protein